ncbi:hypothetical protein F5Y19DRAFT_473659 [Xylariaceae sp. FL1651]|nr:hypothetical protein F5Y19DRAFT_473659 [Xylariaceae sp. FL1651]
MGGVVDMGGEETIVVVIIVEVEEIRTVTVLDVVIGETADSDIKGVVGNIEDAVDIGEASDVIEVEDTTDIIELVDEGVGDVTTEIVDEIVDAVFEIEGPAIFEEELNVSRALGVEALVDELLVAGVLIAEVPEVKVLETGAPEVATPIPEVLETEMGIAKVLEARGLEVEVLAVKVLTADVLEAGGLEARVLEVITVIADVLELGMPVVEASLDTVTVTIIDTIPVFVDEVDERPVSEAMVELIDEIVNTLVIVDTLVGRLADEPMLGIVFILVITLENELEDKLVEELVPVLRDRLADKLVVVIGAELESVLGKNWLSDEVVKRPVDELVGVLVDKLEGSEDRVGKMLRDTLDDMVIDRLAGSVVNTSVDTLTVRLGVELVMLPVLVELLNGGVLVIDTVLGLVGLLIDASLMSDVPALD